IWNDETEGGDDSSPTSTLIALSPLAKGNAYDSTVSYTHSSDLKSMQELFGVYGPNGSFLGDAGSPGTNDFSDLFKPGALGSVPEPASIVLSALALACLSGWRLWKSRSAAC
ncbi:MAG TPA: PEP-CTERM sorting domain-containing protein, partial [Isosphaeraceae bacterium]|nr:PEP-CTERM sorting domain-containing protein [Isosphaeraceae bacterium]